MQFLTRVEEQIMLKLWELNKASVAEIIALYENPKPAYNTISTIIRILEKKKMVGHQKKGRGYLYFPKIPKEAYASFLVEHLITNYYDDNRSQLISSLNKSKTLSELL